MKQYDLKPIKDATKDYDRCSYDNVYCCYVNGNREIRAMYFEKLSALMRTDALKYFEILKESVKGTVNKNTFAAGFSEEEKGEGGVKELLKRMVREGIGKDVMADFCLRLMNAVEIENETNYLITVFENTIDIRPRGTDRLVIDDASEFSFTYLVASICPAKLSDSGLSYDEEEKIFRTRITDWVAGKPVMSLMYPVPCGDGADLDHAVIFSKSKDPETAEAFIRAFTGTDKPPVSSDKAFEELRDIIRETIEIESRPEVLDRIDESLEIYRSDHEEDEDAVITKEKFLSIAEHAGATENELENLDIRFSEKTADDSIPVYAIKELGPALKKVSVTVKTRLPEILMKKEIDGAEYLCIPISEGVKLNHEIL